MPDQSCFSFSEGPHPQQLVPHGTQASGNADQGIGGGSGRRPSLAQICQIQKQHTMDNDDYNEKILLPSAPSPEFSTGNGQGAEYHDTKNLFKGLQQDYAWMEGTNSI